MKYHNYVVKQKLNTISTELFILSLFAVFVSLKLIFPVIMSSEFQVMLADSSCVL